jgi:hypothetical protein
MAVPYYERLVVENIAALKALTISTTPAIADGIFIGVANDGSGYPAWYYYDSASTATTLGVDIIQPDSPTTGRWFVYGRQQTVYTFGTDDPTDDPPTFDGTGGRISIHIQIEEPSPSSTAYIWIGVDTTGVIGNNGWLQTYGLV